MPAWIPANPFNRCSPSNYNTPTLSPTTTTRSGEDLSNTGYKGERRSASSRNAWLAIPFTFLMSLRGAIEWGSRPFAEWKVIPALTRELPFVGESGVEAAAATLTLGACLFILTALHSSSVVRGKND